MSEVPKRNYTDHRKPCVLTTWDVVVFYLQTMIKVKEEFKQLIPPLTKEEFKQLEDNCMKDGIREKIITWNGFIIDGHNRFEIATKWGLDYQTESKRFDSENDVKEWMINNQFGRRNLSNYQRSVLALELESVFSERAREKQIEGGKNKVVQKSEQAPMERKAITQISKVANVSHDTIAKVKVIQNQAEDELKTKLVNGEVSINQAYQEIKKQKAEDFKAKIEQRIEQKTNENPISIEEQEILNKIAKGETVVINMNKHFHVLKYAKEKSLYQPIDRYSEWGNPFFLDSDGNRDEVCNGYAEYFKHKRSLHYKIKNLKGKVLGCHCAPLRCHGDHLKNLADEN
jgi:flagellar biosynthesis regulator FlaF